MKPLAHTMILASAGSGKTYALTSRFISLLAHDVPADRIVALTFTRKAAGEFFDEILQKLADAARDADAASRIAREVEMTHLNRADFLRMLRGVIDAMPRLRLGTLDSFFGRVARAFPFELGLDGEFEILEEFTARIERQKVLRRMFVGGGRPDAGQREFIEAFKRATFGAEEKRLSPRLETFLDEHQEHFLEAPESIQWGHAERIWPAGCAWLGANADRVSAAGVLTQWIEIAPIQARHRERWRRFLAALETWSPGATPPRELTYVLEKALGAWPQLTAGRGELVFGRERQPLSVAACQAMVDLCRYAMGTELQRRLAVTQGIYAVLRAYDTTYHELVRKAGKLTFSDVQRLLQPDDGVAPLTRNAESDDRLFIDYRLDAEIDHWLLDEFQDTSYGQWSVLRNLIDEVVQDPSGTRSFFCVGDVKQAIFTWREGDPRLFREIRDHYNAAQPGVLVERHLTQSWRSGPAVIEMVNAVFGQAATIGALFPPDAALMWNEEWREHTSALPARNGQCAVLWVEDQLARWTQVVKILQEIRPIERGLTCAVLVQRNSTGAQLADFLRREGRIPAVAEADLRVCTDNPLGAAMLALLQAAAHPGDTHAWEHVQMTPLGTVLAAEGIVTREQLTRRVLGDIHNGGFERVMEAWLRKLESKLELTDSFSRMRAGQFATAAARFDETGSRSVAEFIQFMERHVVREAESDALVRVMTIHKSKGLGFDVVILPDLEGNRLDIRREGLAVQKEGDRSIEWILELPPKLFYEADAVLSRHVRTAESDACYEALSLLYVALTRAKRATYALIEPVEGSASHNYPRLLGDTLGSQIREIRMGGLVEKGCWSNGDPGWHLALPLPVQPDSDFVDEDSDGIEVATSARRRSASPASQRIMGTYAASTLFSLEADVSLRFGANVHSLLAEVEWKDANAAAAGWRLRGAAADVIAEADACLQAPSLEELWTPRGPAEVWRERAFEVVLDGAWVSGVFDRVVVELGAQQRVEWITVFDFKTDRIADDGAMQEALRRHAGQLNLYRRAAAILAGVPVEMVSCELVFTRIQRRVRVPAA